MQIIEPSFEILDRVNGPELLARIERYGRTCYKSEDKITTESAPTFVRMLLARGHESVLEHEKITVRVICNRGVSHEIVRHRIAAYSQESTRYCNYGKGDGITVIRPLFFAPDSPEFEEWETAMEQAEDAYNALLAMGASPQEARSVLPNSLKTEIVITYNLREWRHFFRLRTSPAAHPQMREIAIPMLREFRRLVPVVFDDIEVA
jgi:thymidylate synthase (FAD)